LKHHTVFVLCQGDKPWSTPPICALSGRQTLEHHTVLCFVRETDLETHSHYTSSELSNAWLSYHIVLALRPPSTVLRSQSTVFRPPSSVHRPPFSVHRPPFSVHRPPSTVFRPPFIVHHPSSSVPRPPSFVLRPLFFVLRTPFAFRIIYCFQVASSIKVYLVCLISGCLLRHLQKNKLLTWPASIPDI
jgi:hypothetical protein